MRIELETRRFYLGRDYSEAIAGSGGRPVHIPLIPDPEFIAGVMEQLDGVLLPGSDTDVDPARFGEEPHPRLKRVIPEKDETEMLVLAEAENRALPVFAICYGMQALNVSRGGTLIQDIDSQVSNPVKHEQGPPLERNSHSIQIVGDGLLSKLVGRQAVKVNSHHHQAIKMVGKNLAVTAEAKDGVLECIEDSRPGRFAVGVQWHPELNWQQDPLSASLFHSFIEACRTSRNT